MTNKQKKAKARLNKKLKEILGTDLYKESCSIGKANYNTVEDFVQAAIKFTREVRSRDKIKKKSA